MRKQEEKCGQTSPAAFRPPSLRVKTLAMRNKFLVSFIVAVSLANGSVGILLISAVNDLAIPPGRFTIEELD